jgi:Bax protein
LALLGDRPATPRRPLLLRAIRGVATIAFVLVGAASMGGVTVRSVGLVTQPAIVAAALPPEWGFTPSPIAQPVDQLHWWTLREAFDRIGFDLDSVASGSAPVPRVALVMLPGDLDGIDDLDARKDLFLRAFLPVVLAVNEHILDDRKQLAALRTKIAGGGTLLGGEVQWLLALADTYDQPDLDFDALLRKVDAIPPSLALAQAIEESGWGTSRIAKGQNAMFGQFGEDPLRGWDYRSFDSLTAAVESYARNLNTHRAYREFRQARATMRGHGGSMDAFALAATLFRYSERGPHYVKDLRWIMRDNDLRAFDSAHLDVGEKVAVIASNDDARDFELPRP